jgi:hypothetical protein
MERAPYTVNELKIDGYYYSDQTSDKYIGVLVFLGS